MMYLTTTLQCPEANFAGGWGFDDARKSMAASSTYHNQRPGLLGWGFDDARQSIVASSNYYFTMPRGQFAGGWDLKIYLVIE